MTPDLIANGLLSLGASVVMSQDVAEIEELTQYASTVVVKVGTLDETLNRLQEQLVRLLQLKKTHYS